MFLFLFFVFFGFVSRFQNVLNPFSFSSMEKPTSERILQPFTTGAVEELRPLFLERQDVITHILGVSILGMHVHACVHVCVYTRARVSLNAIMPVIAVSDVCCLSLRYSVVRPMSYMLFRC